MCSSIHDGNEFNLDRACHASDIGVPKVSVSNQLEEQ